MQDEIFPDQRIMKREEHSCKRGSGCELNLQCEPNRSFCAAPGSRERSAVSPFGSDSDATPFRSMQLCTIEERVIHGTEEHRVNREKQQI